MSRRTKKLIIKMLVRIKKLNLNCYFNNLYTKNIFYLLKSLYFCNFLRKKLLNVSVFGPIQLQTKNVLILACFAKMANF